MRGLIAADLLKIRKRRMAWILLALTSLIIALLYGALFVTTQGGDSSTNEATRNLENELRFTNAMAYGDVFVTRVVALLAVILAASMTASEFGWRTVVSATMWTGERTRLVIATVAALGVFTAVALAFGFATMLAADYLGSRLVLEDTTVMWRQLPFDLVAGALRSWLIVMVYVSLAVALAFRTKSTAAAVSIPLVALLIEPIGVAIFRELGGPIAGAADLSLSRNIDGLLAANGLIEGSASASADYPSAWRGAFFLAAFCAVTIWLAARGFSRSDITE